MSMGNPEVNLDFIKQVGMDLSNESVEERRGNRRTKHSLSWIATVGLAGTVVSLHDQSIARAVEKMQAFPPHLLAEAMRELGNIMQNRSPTTVTYPDVSTGFLAPMRFFHKFISTSGKDIGSHSLTHYNDFHNAKACGKEKMKSYARAPTQPVTRRPRLHSSNFRSCAQRWDRC